MISGRLIVALTLLVLPHQNTVVSEPLEPLQFLVGSCWTGKLQGVSGEDTHCFEAVFGGRFVRDRHVVRGGKTPYEGETIYAWDPKTKKVIFTYWASDGSITTGTMERQGNGDLVFDESYANETGGLRLRTTFVRMGNDAYSVVTLKRVDAGWAEMFRTTMRRTAKSPG